MQLEVSKCCHVCRYFYTTWAIREECLRAEPYVFYGCSKRPSLEVKKPFEEVCKDFELNPKLTKERTE